MEDDSPKDRLRRSRELTQELGHTETKRAFLRCLDQAHWRSPARAGIQPLIRQMNSQPAGITSYPVYY